MYLAVITDRFAQHRHTDGINARDCPHALRVKTQVQISKRFTGGLQRDSITSSGCHIKDLKKKGYSKKTEEKKGL